MSTTIDTNSANELFKQFFQTLGKELAHRGHKVPHQVLLESASASLKQRSWNHLCATLKQAKVLPETTPVTEPEFLPCAYDLFLPRLARTVGVASQPLPRSNIGIEAAKGMLSNYYLDFQLTAHGSVFDLHWNPVTQSFLTDAHGNEHYRVTCVQLPAMEPFVMDMSEVGGKPMLDRYFGASASNNLLPVLMPEAETFGLEFSGPFVKAEIHSDDYRSTATFDGRPFLAGCTDESLLQVWAVGLTGDYCTDGIADEVFKYLPSQEIQDTFDYVTAAHKVDKDIGFECSLERTGFISWIRAERPAVFGTLLCEEEGVDFFNDNNLHGFRFEYSGQSVAETGFESKELAISRASALLIELGAALL